jgi:enoyl-CoA hydratase
MSELVTLDKGAGGVATIRLSRPPMNALNSLMQEQLRDAAVEASSDPSIRAVVVVGSEKVFAAGADVKEFAALDHAQMMRDAERLSDAIASVARIPKPVIAAVTGFALGGGCELALTADFRVSADNARWGQPEMLLGVIPGGGGTQRLPRLIGVAKAKELIYSGRMIDAAEALALGLVDVVVPAEEVYPRAVAMAEKYAKGPALALQAAKAAIDTGLDGSLAAGLRLESQLFASLFATEDRAIGMASFFENGPGKARFVGTDDA